MRTYRIGDFTILSFPTIQARNDYEQAHPEVWEDHYQLRVSHHPDQYGQSGVGCNTTCSQCPVNTMYEGEDDSCRDSLLRHLRRHYPLTLYKRPSPCSTSFT